MDTPKIRVLPRDALRQILESLADADRKAIFIDHFPAFASRLSDGMDARQQVNLLLSLHETTEISAGLYRVAKRDSTISACIERYLQASGPQISPRVALPVRNMLFTGREKILTSLHHKIHQHRGVAVIGLGGIGKSSLALEYGHRYGHLYSLVYWLSAADPGALSLGLFTLGRYLREGERLDRADLHEQHPEGLRTYATEWLTQHSNWILLIDNADNPEPLRTLLPDFRNGFLLATTRHPDPMLLALQPFELSEFSSEEARDFLLKRTGAAAEPLDEDMARRELVRELGHLPLALDQAGAYMAAHKTSVSTYLTAYQQRRISLFPSGATAHERESVATVWSLSFDAVEHDCPVAADILRFSAFLSPDFIPEKILYDGASKISDAVSGALDPDNPLAMDDILGPLLRHSLIRRLPPVMPSDGRGGYGIHRLVQGVVRARLGPAERVWVERTVRVFNAAITETTLHDRSWSTMILSCAEELFLHVERLNLNIPEVARIINLSAKFLDNYISHPLAEPLLKRALAIHIAVYGENSILTAESLHNLGWFFHAHGFLTEAEPLLRRALAIREALLAPNHLDISWSVYGLACVLEKLGQIDTAEKLYRKGLAIRERIFGDDSPYTARSMTQLAFRLHNQGRLEEAEILLRRAIAIGEKDVGEDSPQLVGELNNLAGLLERQRRFDEAESLYHRALAICLKAFGANHRRTARARFNLQSLLENRGKLHGIPK